MVIKNKLKKIDSIMFRVKNLEQASRFYGEEMGLKKVWEDKKEGMIGFIFPESDSEIVIHTNKGIPNLDFNFLVESVDEFIKNFKGKIVIRMEIRGGKLAVLEDLDGNKIPIVDLTKFGNQEIPLVNYTLKGVVCSGLLDAQKCDN